MFPPADYPPLPMHILEHARNRSDHAAIVHGERTITYEELAPLIRRGAAGLRAIGIASGELVMAAAGDKLDLLLIILSAMAAGLPVVPVSGREEDIGRFAAALKPRLIVSGSADEVSPDLTGFPCQTIAALLVAEPGDMARLTHDDIGVLLPTSGTTGGERRGTMLSHRALAVTAQSGNERMGVDATVVELVTAPLEHSFGLGRARCVLHLGGTVVLQPGLFAPARVVDALRAEGCNMLSCSVPALSLLLDTQAEALAALAACIRWIEIGASHLKADRRRRLLSLLPRTRCFINYGLSESPKSTIIELNAETAKIDTIGRPTPWVRVRIVDENNVEVVPGVIGRIHLDGANKASGYHGNEAAWRRKLVGDWLDTGDLGMLDADGYLSFIGRADDMINVGGLKVAPEEVEEALAPLLKDVGFAVAGVADPTGIEGFVPALFVETEDDAAIGIDQVRDHLRDRLAPFKIPRMVYTVPSLPRTTTTRKVRRAVLRTIAAEREAARLPRIDRLIGAIGEAGEPDWPVLEGASTLTRRQLLSLVAAAGDARISAGPGHAGLVVALRAAALADDGAVGRAVLGAQSWLPAGRDTVLAVGGVAPGEAVVLGAVLHVLAAGGRCVVLAGRAVPVVAEDLGWIARDRVRHVLLDGYRLGRLAMAELHLADAFAHPEFEQVLVVGPPPDPQLIARFRGTFGFAPRQLTQQHGVWSTRLLEPAPPTADAQAIWLRLRDIAASVFRCAARDLAPAASANTTKGWDSLSFLNLILEVEATFQRRLTPAGIMGINQLGDVVRLLESKQST